MDADYPGAIVVEARNYGYEWIYVDYLNRPRAWCLHTPEEVADSDPQTPYYFHNTTRDASTTYFVSYLGFVFQCVPESEGAYANAVEGKPYPVWADSKVNLNLQTLSVEIEGFASNIHQTMPRDSPQWKALVALIAHRCKALNIPPGRTFGHYAVSVNRSDPGQLNIPLLISDVIAKMEEDTMFTVIKGSGPAQYIFTGSSRWWIRSGAFRAELEALGLIGPGFLQVSDDLLNTIPEVQTIAQAVRAEFEANPLR